MPLRLKNLIAFDSTELTDRAINRAHIIGVGKRSRAFLQWPRKKFVEALVARDIRIGRLTHIDRVTPNKPADQPRRQAACLRAGDHACEGGERLFGNEVLREDVEAIGHDSF